jgi:hypothetical protein
MQFITTTTFTKHKVSTPKSLQIVVLCVLVLAARAAPLSDLAGDAGSCDFVHKQIAIHLLCVRFM